MADLAALRTQIKNLMQRQDLANADVDKYLNLMKRHLQSAISSWYTIKTSNFATVQGTKQYTMPTDWRDPIVLWILDGTERIILEFVDRPHHAFFHPDNTKEDRPTKFHVADRQIWLDPTPKGVYTVQRDYNAYIADYVAATDSDVFSTNFELGLLMGCCDLMSIQLGSWENAGQFHGRFIEQQRTEQKVQTGHKEGGTRAVKLPYRGS